MATVRIENTIQATIEGSLRSGLNEAIALCFTQKCKVHHTSKERKEGLGGSEMLLPMRKYEY